MSGGASARPADPNGTCRLRHPAAYADSLKALPPTIRAKLKATVGAIADRGEFFNATDAVRRPAPFNRFIRGGQSGRRWFVWYEHGGFAYWREIVLFQRVDSLAPAMRVRSTSPDLCAQTDRLLDEKP